jgi:cyclopropane-fatty-acyl-phospholipid synthase
LRQRLSRDGIAVLQAITIEEDHFDNYRRNPDFIQKYIFPGGMLPTVEILGKQIADAGLRLVSSEFFGSSYARTLAEWCGRFHHAWPAIEELGFDIRFRRMWEYYLAYCQAGFEAGVLNVGLYKLTHA